MCRSRHLQHLPRASSNPRIAAGHPGQCAGRWRAGHGRCAGVGAEQPRCRRSGRPVQHAFRTGSGRRQLRGQFRRLRHQCRCRCGDCATQAGAVARLQRKNPDQRPPGLARARWAVRRPGPGRIGAPAGSESAQRRERPGGDVGCQRRRSGACGHPARARTGHQAKQQRSRREHHGTDQDRKPAAGACQADRRRAQAG